MVCDPSWCFNTCLIWSVHVVDLYNFCDPGRVRSFRVMWPRPLMVVHIMDLYNFMNWLGPSIMFIGVLNVCRIRPPFFFFFLFFFLHVWSLLGPFTFWICISLALVRSVHFVDLGVWPLVGSVHLVDWIFNPWWGPSTLWTLYKFLTHGGARPLCGLCINF